MLASVLDLEALKPERMRPLRRIYAEAGVPEYWIVDVDGAAVEIHTDPRRGAYRSIVRLDAGDLRPLELPGIVIGIAEILPR
jgi:Uma2 family endonuclease